MRSSTRSSRDRSTAGSSPERGSLRERPAVELEGVVAVVAGGREDQATGPKSEADDPGERAEVAILNGHDRLRAGPSRPGDRPDRDATGLLGRLRRRRIAIAAAGARPAIFVDDERRLLGVLVFREMMVADPQQSISEVMIRNPFVLRATMPIMEGMREVLSRHHPAYPV